MAVDEMIERLGFWIDRSGAPAVLREVGGGCHPATRSELALWDALEAAREDAERWRALRELDGGEIYALLGDCDGIHPEQADAAIDQARGKGVLREAE